MTASDRWLTEQLEQTSAFQKLSKAMANHDPQAALAKGLQRRFKRRYNTTPLEERQDLKELKHV